MAAAPLDVRRSARTSYPTEKELDSKYVDLTLDLNKLTDEIPGEELFAIETLLRMKQELTDVFMKFQKIVGALDRAKHVAQAHQEREELKADYELWKSRYKEWVSTLNDLRRAAGYEVSTLASIPFPSYSPAIMSGTDKCKMFLEQQMKRFPFSHPFHQFQLIFHPN